MTLKELEQEAKNYRYRLVKLPEKVSLLPCPVCGKRGLRSGSLALMVGLLLYFVAVALADLTDIMAKIVERAVSLGIEL